ncbi:RIP metalloprotease RseP [Jannaschia sp. W003]|uniref:RIP metalloprotease RseP n=1 Tax=Jannaschia sp. W003 TaxID=2867012 RepID=UPI0021A9056A|nr:RIP metalloprotease RseP [Jannaschia sp. W003]UWQ20463.1 RIP metalloprotease RseP [Jannaschia sp. W003]
MDLGGIAQFGGLLWTLLAFVTALSVIVAIHEYGHYIVGRWCGIKAEVFSIGFGPVLVSRMDRHGTRWQLAALPLGGYVKFRGDANAASVGADGQVAAMTAAERETTMTGAKLWKRAATVAAGPVFNFILSILVFAAFVLASGRAIETPVIGAVAELPPGVEFLQEGDEVVSIDGTPVGSLTELNTLAGELTDAETVRYEVLRDGERLEVDASAPFLPLAASVQPRSAAWEVGMRPGDYVLAIDGEPITTFRDMQDRTAAGDGRPMELRVWRPSEARELTLTVVPRRMDLPLPDGGFETRWLMGLSGGLVFESPTEAAGPIEALSYGVSQTLFIVRSSLSALGHIVSGAISTCNLSGPIGIAETSGAAATLGASNFIWFIAVLSTAVGLLNLFPIPVLDGGHLVFHAYEAVRGRPPSDDAVRVLMTLGVALMGALMLFALFNDVMCP